MTTFETELGVVTHAQLVALGSAGVVFLFLLAANLAMCRLYRRATGEPQRRAKKDQRKQSDVWVYHVYRTKPAETTAEAASVQILKKPRASHDNVQAAITAPDVKAGNGNALGLEECQALQELEATADLFLHDHSGQPSSPHSFDLDLDPCTLAGDLVLDPCTSAGDLDFDPCTLAGDLDPCDFSDLDKVSVTSVKMADFENDYTEGSNAKHQTGQGGQRRRKRAKESGEETAKGGESYLPSTIPVTEFHNEAFDFAHETAVAAVESVQEVEL